MFEQSDIPVIGVLIFLEGVLSIDNSVVLALLAGKLPKQLQKKALTYGLAGAVVFRLIALSMASRLMEWTWVKFVGGGYLLYLAVDYFFLSKDKNKEDALEVAELEDISHKKFWQAVILIELTDMAFAVDSILAAVAISNKLPVIVLGGVIGLILMRFAATLFIKLLEKYPRLETSAYLLISLVGTKLFVQGFRFEQVDFHDSHNPAFWTFWSLLFIFVVVGFLKPSKHQKSGSKSSKGS